MYLNLTIKWNNTKLKTLSAVPQKIFYFTHFYLKHNRHKHLTTQWPNTTRIIGTILSILDIDFSYFVIISKILNQDILSVLRLFILYYQWWYIIQNWSIYFRQSIAFWKNSEIYMGNDRYTIVNWLLFDIEVTKKVMCSFDQYIVLIKNCSSGAFVMRYEMRDYNFSSQFEYS